MNGTRILGIVILALGAALVAIGLDSRDAAIDQVSEAVTGRYTDETMWYLIGGGVAVLGGALLTLFSSRSRT